MMTIKLALFDGKVDEDEWRFLISGQANGAPYNGENPAHAWLKKRSWNELCMLDCLANYKGVAESFGTHMDAWKDYFEDDATQSATVPGGLNEKLNTFQKMLVLRCFRPDKMADAIQNYVTGELGGRFIEPPPFDLPLSFKTSQCTSPLIFVLSIGVDPMRDFLNFCEEMNMRKKQVSISLGQGQGPKAAAMVELAVERGEWVLLQNCHLCVSWMPELERICEEFDPEKVHKDFRLWLSSMPSKAFPVSILQNGVKMTNEPPKGLRANLKTTFYKQDDEKLNTTNKPEKYKRLFFALAFFHAVVIERKKYGALGWNIPYSFNETDLAICENQLQMYLDMYDEVPYSVLNLLTSFINYGGRVTDDKDLRTIDIILKQYYSPKSLTSGHKLSGSGIYIIPHIEDEENCKDDFDKYIDQLPIVPDPEVFGMHKNADITCAENETYKLLSAIVSLSGSSGGGDTSGRDKEVLDLAIQIEAGLTQPDEGFMEEDATKLKFPIRYEESMNTVLRQEQQKFNRLLRVMKSSLAGLKLAVQGLAVMSSDLENMSNAFYTQGVPAVWENVAYPSLKPLGAWVSELTQRCEFIVDWVDNGTPAKFWVSGFFFPQAFLTGNLQNYARKYQLPIDTISNNFLMRDDLAVDGSDVKEGPKDGCYIWGLWLEGAGWSNETHTLADSEPRRLYVELPVCHLDPVADRPYTPDSIYRCPVYKTLLRAGMLSTTGHSTNFVCWMEIPSGTETIFRPSLVSETNQAVQLADSEKWAKAGVALFCQLRF